MMAVPSVAGVPRPRASHVSEVIVALRFFSLTAVHKTGPMPGCDRLAPTIGLTFDENNFLIFPAHLQDIQPLAHRLSLQHLEMLVAIKQTATLAEAAAQLRITPSALTHRVREAERRLGVRLFAKDGRALRPNTAAQIL